MTSEYISTLVKTLDDDAFEKFVERLSKFKARSCADNDRRPPPLARGPGETKHPSPHPPAISAGTAAPPLKGGDGREASVSFLPGRVARRSVCLLCVNWLC